MAAANFIRSHPEDFLPFLPSSEDGGDAGMLTPVQFEDYCSSITNTATWGGEPEIVALSRAFNIPIHIVQGGKPEIVVHEPDERTNDKVVRISYHRKLYGLGEVSGWWSLSCLKSNLFFFFFFFFFSKQHYNSLHPAKEVS